jgi:hypothetical protein
MDFDTRVKLAVYRAFAATGQAPAGGELAAELAVTPAEIHAAFQRLRAKRLLVLESDGARIRMAPPFSAVPTPFRVGAAGRSYFANCVWDAYGVAAALHCDVDVRASCGCCKAPMELAVRDRKLVPSAGVAHFAVPAAQWWEDIVFT